MRVHSSVLSASLVIGVAASSLFLFQNCGKRVTSDPVAGASVSTSGFPRWSVPASYLSVATIRSESPATLPSTLPAPVVFIEASGASVQTMERYDLTTIKVTEVGTSGGFLQLSLLPDGRYRKFVFIKSSSYGLAYGQITREIGRFEMQGMELSLTPEHSESQTGSSSGAVVTMSNPLARRTYLVYEALFETLLSTGETNGGYVLRGPCPAFAVPVTCISSMTAEHRLQAMTVVP